MGVSNGMDHAVIRDLESSDVPACIEIVRTNWGDEVATRFTDEVGHAFNTTMKWPPHYFVWDAQGDILGFAGMIPSWVMHGVWDFIWINVKPEAQNKKIGAHLTSLRISEVQRQGGAVINLMTKNDYFFTHFGFEVIRTYQGDWHLMTLQMKALKL